MLCTRVSYSAMNTFNLGVISYLKLINTSEITIGTKMKKKLFIKLIITNVQTIITRVYIKFKIEFVECLLLFDVK